MQLELRLYPGALSTVLVDYLSYQRRFISDATVVDYEERIVALERWFGALLPIRGITFSALQRVAEEQRGAGLRDVTIKRRMVFLLAAMKHAVARGELETVPPLPRFKNDGERRQALHTVEQWGLFRQYVPDGRFRWLYDLAFWTGHHTHDLFSLEWRMLDLDRELDMNGESLCKGMYLRRNHKNPRCREVWLPMQPELKLIVRALYAENPQRHPNDYILGRLSNLHRTLRASADRAVAAGHEMPRVSPIDLRRSFASMLSGREYPNEFVRIALGHEGEGRANDAGVFVTLRSTTATRHYLRPTPALLALGIPGRGGKPGGGVGQ